MRQSVVEKPFAHDPEFGKVDPFADCPRLPDLPGKRRGTAARGGGLRGANGDALLPRSPKQAPGGMWAERKQSNA
jgi:hypothetical protein